VYVPFGTIVVPDAWLKVHEHEPGYCLGKPCAVDEAASDDWRMKEWPLSCAIGQRRLVWPLSHHTTYVRHISPRERDAGAVLATLQKMVGHESVTTTAGYDRRGDAAKCKAADLMHVPFFLRQA